MFTNRPALNGSEPEILEKDTTTVPSATDGVMADVYHIREQVQRKLLADSEGEPDPDHQPHLKQSIETHFNQVLAEESLIHTRADRARLLDWVCSQRGRSG